MGYIEQLAESYGRHIATPWQQTVAGAAQRVILVVYDKARERALRARKAEFERVTLQAVLGEPTRFGHIPVAQHNSGLYAATDSSPHRAPKEIAP
jgi:hypothetical protein